MEKGQGDKEEIGGGGRRETAERKRKAEVELERKPAVPTWPASPRPSTCWPDALSPGCLVRPPPRQDAAPQPRPLSDRRASSPTV